MADHESELEFELEDEFHEGELEGEEEAGRDSGVTGGAEYFDDACGRRFGAADFPRMRRLAHGLRRAYS